MASAFIVSGRAARHRPASRPIATADQAVTGLRRGGRALKAEAGTAAVEFAILAPVLILLLLGIVVYGGYFLIAHSVQQLANDAARAALAGLSDAERKSLAANCLATELGNYSFIDPKLVQLAYADQAQVMTVNIAYDASASPFWAVNGVIPMPSSVIVRGASVQLGGF